MGKEDCLEIVLENNYFPWIRRPREVDGPAGTDIKYSKYGDVQASEKAALSWKRQHRTILQLCTLSIAAGRRWTVVTYDRQTRIAAIEYWCLSGNRNCISTTKKPSDQDSVLLASMVVARRLHG